MKKKLFLITFLLSNVIAAIACDICGSGAGGGYMGLLPGFRKKFISLRYTQNSLVSHVGANGNSTYLTSKETFRIAELWGAANVGKRFRVAAFIPVNFISRSNGTGDYAVSGMGDISLLGYYNLLAKEKTIGDNKLLSQSLWIGTGIKLPTGHYNPEEKNVLESAQNTFQPGTGSTDLSIHLLYDIRLQNAGININAGYKVNTYNKYDYTYGNKLTTNLLAYYQLKTGKNVLLTPNTGVLFESSVKDKKAADLEVWETGGHSLMGTVGLECLAGQIGMGINFQTPLSQELGEGKVQAKNRGMAYISFSF